jgi:hypothetical protein
MKIVGEEKKAKGKDVKKLGNYLVVISSTERRIYYFLSGTIEYKELNFQYSYYQIVSSQKYGKTSIISARSNGRIEIYDIINNQITKTYKLDLEILDMIVIKDIALVFYFI